MPTGRKPPYIERNRPVSLVRCINTIAATAFVIGGSIFALFVGTLYFGASLLVALLGDLSTAQEHRLVWSPEFVGCTLFLLSGHLALTELRRERPRGRRAEDLGWWIAVVNQLGSALFMVGAPASLTLPTGRKYPYME